MGVTLKELARVAGVSAATVSRALNGRPGVSVRLRERIAREAARRGYTPDAHARALVTGHVPFLGLVVPDITNPFFPAIARGAEEEAARHGYSLLLVDTDNRRDRLSRALDLLSSRRVAGLILAVGLDGEMAEGIDLCGRAVMASVDAPARSGLPVVSVDDRLGGLLVGRHLIALGRRRIGFVSGPGADRSARDRLAGLKDAIDEAGDDCRLGPVSHGAWTVESGVEQGRAILTPDGAPDAVFAANDLLAIGVAQAAAEAGLRVGKDLALVGYDDIDVARHAWVPLTTVRQPKLDLGREAARLLVAAVEGHAQTRHVLLEPSLVVRRSCGAGRLA